jgi:flagellar hook-associated protein 1
MSLGTAMSAALSGLQVTARGTQMVADNIANAGTEGYGTRDIAQAARVIGTQGSGVLILGETRASNPVLLASLRDARATQAGAELVTDFWSGFASSLDDSAQGGSVAKRLAALDAAVTQALPNPQSPAALARIAQEAEGVTRQFHDLQTNILSARDQADARIAADVGRVNTLLQDIATLNRDIQRQSIVGGGTNGMQDQRQVLIDELSVMIPVREIPRDLNRIMLVADDGTILLDQSTVQFSFQKSPALQPGDTVASGGAAQLLMGNRAIGAGSAFLGDGRLSGAFAVRDHHAQQAQAMLDTLAQDLVTRFAGPGADPTLSVGEFGLFQDPAAPNMPADPVGLAGRISLSPLIRPDDPSTLWRLRDGLGAGSPGPVGETRGLSALHAALRSPMPSPLPGLPQQDAAGLVIELTGLAARSRIGAEVSLAGTRTRATLLTEQIQAAGVDTDAQMQRLLILEKAYAANARVISAVDSMMRTLLEI